LVDIKHILECIVDHLSAREISNKEAKVSSSQGVLRNCNHLIIIANLYVSQSVFADEYGLAADSD
jgi:hypothetical protein